jgi:hypothetical protein
MVYSKTEQINKMRYEMEKVRSKLTRHYEYLAYGHVGGSKPATTTYAQHGRDEKAVGGSSERAGSTTHQRIQGKSFRHLNSRHLLMMVAG